MTLKFVVITILLAFSQCQYLPPPVGGNMADSTSLKLMSPPPGLYATPVIANTRMMQAAKTKPKVVVKAKGKAKPVVKKAKLTVKAKPKSKVVLKKKATGKKLKLKVKLAKKPILKTKSKNVWSAKQLSGFVSTIGTKQKAAKKLFKASQGAASKILAKLKGRITFVQNGVKKLIAQGKKLTTRYIKLRADIVKTTGGKAGKKRVLSEFNLLGKHTQQLAGVKNTLNIVQTADRRLNLADVKNFENDNKLLISKFLNDANSLKKNRKLQKKTKKAPKAKKAKKAKKGKLSKMAKKGKSLLNKLKLKLKVKGKKGKKGKKSSKKDDKKGDKIDTSKSFNFKVATESLNKLEKSWKVAKKGVIKAMAMKKKLSAEVKSGMAQSAKFFKKLSASLKVSTKNTTDAKAKPVIKGKKPVLKAKLKVKLPKKAALKVALKAKPKAKAVIKKKN